MDELTSRLADAYRSGTLPDTVLRLLREGTTREALAGALVGLHNAGTVDLLAAFLPLKAQTGGGVDFFQLRRILETVLPDLEAPVANALRCGLTLFRDAGHDGAAGMIFNAVEAFLKQRPDRPREALAEIEAHPDDLAPLLAGVIAAGAQDDLPGFTAHAIRLGDAAADPALRRQAAHALGRLALGTDPALLEPVLAALERWSAIADDFTYAAMIRTSGRLLRLAPAQGARIVALIDRALAGGGAATLHEAAALLFDGETPRDLLPLAPFLAPLQRVPPEHTGTLDVVDAALADRLATPDRNAVLTFLQSYLIAHRGIVGIKTFDSCAERIRENSGLLATVVTRWLLSGERALAEAAAKLASRGEEATTGLAIDPGEFDPANERQVGFLARKVVGHLALKPGAAVALLLSMLGHVPVGGGRMQIQRLLYNPLLLNHPGETRAALEHLLETASDEVKAAAGECLKALQAYLDNLGKVGRLKALQPSETERQAYMSRMNDRFAEAMEKAEEKSIMRKLAKRQVLLYGRSSVNYVETPGQEPRRMEMNLSEIGSEMSWPRLETIDPVGLPLMLVHFKAERPVS